VEDLARILVFHKPKGVTVTRSDELGRKTVYDVLPDWVSQQGWVPVGRLDRDSRGLLLLVRDKRLVEGLGRPGACAKVYEVWVRGVVTEEAIGRATEGVSTALGTLGADRVKWKGSVGGKTRLRVTLREGKNRQIRRLFGGLKDPRSGRPLKVLELKRLSFGPLELDLPSGAWRPVTAGEEERLYKAAGFR
jgi:23S rRNA pseudouridine2605 synthase